VKKGLMLFSVLALVVVTMMWSSDTVAYQTITGGCDSCHDWGYSTSSHQLHFGNGCGSCHVVNGDDPFTLTCASCHNGSSIINGHNDHGITSCAICHGDVSNDNSTMGQAKQLFN